MSFTWDVEKKKMCLAFCDKLQASSLPSVLNLVLSGDFFFIHLLQSCIQAHSFNLTKLNTKTHFFNWICVKVAKNATVKNVLRDTKRYQKEVVCFKVKTQHILTHDETDQ